MVLEIVFIKILKNPEAARKWVEFLSGEEANKLSAERELQFQPMKELLIFG